MFSFGIIFIVYQFKFVEQLQNDSRSPDVIAERLNRNIPLAVENRQSTEEFVVKREIIRGIRIRDLDHYTKKFPNQKFKCLEREIEISFSRVNDDYCDCPDGSDETYTNACSNGKFYCTKQTRHVTGRGKDVFVASSRINDGICDCTDCSDEFKTSH